MKPRKYVALCFVLVALVAVWLAVEASRNQPNSTEPTLGETTEGTSQPPKSVEKERLASAIDNVTSSAPFRTMETIQEFVRKQELASREWRTPIDFYGKVVDEDENPVEGASVSLSWNNLSGTQNSSTQSDASGLFRLKGEQGKFLSVIVNKEGYYARKPHGEGFFYAGQNDNFVPDEQNPVVFHLRRKGVAEPLIVLENDFLVSKEGDPVEVSLTSGRPVPNGQGDMRVQCWTDDKGKTRGEKYDWKCRITIPGGGLLPSTGEFAFEAPLEGYAPQAEINMSASELGWGKSAEGNYFLKLGNGNYARIKFKMIAGGGHFFHIQSFMNPSGSRNLEHDPAVQPKPAFYE